MTKVLPDLSAEMKMRLFTLFSEITHPGPFSAIPSLIPRKIAGKFGGGGGEQPGSIMEL